MSLPDKKSIELQKLYEKWVKKQYWSAHEAACLCNGIEPGSGTEDDSVYSLAVKIHNAVSNGELDCTEIDTVDVADIKVTPVSMYRWARANSLWLPEELSKLMEFVSKTLMQADAGLNGKEQAGIQTRVDDSERVLGACLAVLINYPGECLNKQGKVKTERILKLLGKHSDRLFGDQVPVLSSTAVRDLLNNWVNKLKT